jgi:hypothetical protein
MRIDTLKFAAQLCIPASNASSLSPLFRCVELGPNCMRACSEFVNMQVAVKTDLKDPVLLEAINIDAVIRTIRSGTDIRLTKEGDRVLWRTDTASGYWVLVEQEDQIPAFTHKHFPWQPSKTFPEALLLAQLACQAATVSFGLYGVVVEPVGRHLFLASCNDHALAIVTLPRDGYPGEKVTLRPPVPALLSSMLRAFPESSLDVTDEGIFLADNFIMAHFPVSPSLEVDIVAVATEFTSKKLLVNVNPDKIKRFLSRAKCLTDRHVDPLAEIRLKAGHLSFKQVGSAAGTEEFMLGQKAFAQAVTFPSVLFSMDELSTPLDYIDSLTLDHLDKQVLILQSDVPPFQYIIRGM